MRLTLFLILTIVIVDSYSQSKDIDSLKVMEKAYAGRDEKYIDILNELSYQYVSYDSKQGLVIALDAIKVAKAIDSDLRLATAHSRAAMNYNAQNREESLFHYDTAQLIYSNIGDQAGVAKTAYNAGIVYHSRGEYTSALENNFIALKYFNEQGNQAIAAVINGSIALNYMELYQYIEALSKFKDVLIYYEKNEDTESIGYANTLSNAGILHTRLQDYEIASGYMLKALEIYKLKEYLVGQAERYSSLGTIYDNLGEYEKALNFYIQSRDLMAEMNNSKGLAGVNTNLGAVYNSLGEGEKAVASIDVALPSLIKFEANKELSVAHKTLADVFIKSGSTDSANHHLEKALHYANLSGNLTIKSSTLEAMAQQALWSDDFQNAFTLKEEALEVRKTYDTKLHRDELSRITAKFQYEKQKAIIEAQYEKEKTISTEKLKRQKVINNSFIAVGTSLIIGTFVALFLLRRKNESDLKRQKAELDNQIASSKMRLLSAQMNPHFVFNTLNSINDFVSKNDKLSAKRYLTKFAKIMRKSLQDFGTDNILIKDEVEFLQNYLTLESSRLRDKFKFDIYVDHLIDIESTLIPTMILQPFVENSIWHGISKLEDKGQINIAFKQKGDQIICTVDDNGIGMKKSKVIPGKKSVGIENVKGRLAILNRFYKTNVFGVKITEKPQGLKVDVNVPLEFAY